MANLAIKHLDFNVFHLQTSVKSYAWSFQHVAVFHLLMHGVCMQRLVFDIHFDVPGSSRAADVCISWFGISTELMRLVT